MQRQEPVHVVLHASAASRGTRITMLIAPWPRLNTRVVVYVSTSPDAAIAYAAPVNSPVKV